MRRKSLYLAAAVTAAAIAGSVGTALAVIPPDAPTVAACVGPSGLVRVPDGGTCRQEEQPTTLATAGGLQGVSVRLDALETKVKRLQADDADAQNRLAALESDNSSLKSDVADLQGRVSALESDNADLKSRLHGVTRDGDTLRFSGMNVQIVNGVGDTESTNGLGNLIVGYDANSANFDRDGSHNLVVGDDQGYSSYGGLVAGNQNRILAPGAVVSGGQGNTASGQFSSVSGGSGNTASGDRSSVTGGSGNTASGDGSSVTGGSGNTASGDRSSVSGGGINTASGFLSSVLGGHIHEVSQTSGIFPGAPAPSGYRLVSNTFTVGGSQEATESASCPDGTKVLGGGAWLFTTPNPFDITPKMIQSAPISDTTWEVKIDNVGSARSWDYSLQLSCATER